MNLWRDAASAAALMGALTSHPRLRALNLSRNLQYGGFRSRGQARRVGAALAALLRANAPALQTLDIDANYLGDAGMGPVLEALHHNTHLTKLDCFANDMSEAFARNWLLPAVRASTSLRELAMGNSAPEREAVALVAARARAQQPN
jgi:hypothetical protein